MLLGTALTALPALAQDAAAPDPTQTAQPAQAEQTSAATQTPASPAPAAAPTPAGTPAPKASRPAGWADSDAAQRESVKDRVIAVESPEAVAFAQALSAYLVDELDVQQSERTSLGAEDLATLAGHRRTRRLRIDRDAAEFLDRAGRFARRALAVPRPTPKATLTKEATIFLMALNNAYESSRDIRRISAIQQQNDEFRKTANWQARDRAVRLRDELIDQETIYTSLIDSSWTLYFDDVSPGTIEELEAELLKVAPDADLGGGDLSTLILTNEHLRTQVFSEVGGILTSPRIPVAPSKQEAKALFDEATQLQIELLTTTGVGKLLEEQAKLEAELDEIDARLADKGVNKLDPVARRQETTHRLEVTRRLAQIDVEWHTTPIDRGLAGRLIELQDDLLRFSMFDLGLQGSLYGHAYDAVRDRYTPEEMADDSAKTWDYLEQQGVLLNILQSVNRPEDPLAGLDAPEVGLSQADYLFQLKQAAAGLEKAVPKPPKGKPKKP
ncbi:MAG: hypothetical protein H6825_04900 [Planctomycetes bacterium]|nr:hypothetical protein [Planctomycetota bacterium]